MVQQEAQKKMRSLLDLLYFAKARASAASFSASLMTLYPSSPRPLSVAMTLLLQMS